VLCFSFLEFRRSEIDRERERKMGVEKGRKGETKFVGWLK
jgi:hypothetical protein